jgi:hypothetical protein
MVTTPLININQPNSPHPQLARLPRPTRAALTG